MASFTPITYIGSTDMSQIPNFKQPSKYQVSEYDVSDENAGRTADGAMQKNLLGKCLKVEMSWNVLNSTQAQTIFSYFTANQYFSVTLYSPYSAAQVTKEFYVGDRSAPCYNATLDLWTNVAFNIIQRTPD